MKKDVEQALADFDARKLAEARAAVEAKAREMGFTLTELTGKKTKKAKASAKAKFRNPDNAAQTWSGRGRQPQWYKDALAAGKSEKDLAI